jgi:hypothetical protein
MPPLAEVLFDFKTRPVPARSAAGSFYTRSVWVGMPQLPTSATKCTIYLYRTVEEARAGGEYGGTGFIVGVPSAVDPKVHYTYAVTNWHVAVQDGFPVIRIATQNGAAPDIFDFDSSEWFFVPGGGDVAVVPIRLNTKLHDFRFISTNMFFTKELIQAKSVGPGEDVFMVGRFVDWDGLDQNLPSVRFGNISMMPGPKIYQPNKSEGESYILDMHSRTGYSGSPVFVYRTVGQDLSSGNLDMSNQFIGLLGIHWGQFPEVWEIQDAGPTPTASVAVPVSADKKTIRGLSGMTLVAPAWGIIETLNIDKLRKSREMNDQRLKHKQVQPGGAGPIAEATPVADSEANPKHLEDFKTLQGAASRKTKPTD